MRHNKKFNHLGRTHSHRELMLSNMAVSLILYKRIYTTVAKAKALRVYIEPIITRAKDDGMHARRIAFADLRDKYAVKELFGVVSPEVGTRPGGYTRLVRTGRRQGDNAEMCMIELVDFNRDYSQGKIDGGKKRSTRRSRKRGGAGAPDTTSSAAKPVEQGAATENESDSMKSKE